MDLRNNNDDKVTSTIKKQKHLDYIKTICKYVKDCKDMYIDNERMKLNKKYKYSFDNPVH